MNDSSEQRRYRNIAMATLLGIGVGLLLYANHGGADQVDEIPFSSFLQQVDAHEIGEVEISGSEISGVTRNGESFRTIAPVVTSALVEQLLEDGASVRVEPEADETFWDLLLSSVLPILLIVVIFFFVMRRMQGGGNPVMSFGKSSAKPLEEDSIVVRFSDVAGVDEAKQELIEIVEFLREPQRFTRLGGRIPKGVLLVGIPGTGKTLLARAVAGEAGVPFFSLSGSDFVELFVGVGASRVRDLFQKAREKAPCILFIDEIDAVGRQRGAGIGGGHDEREQTLNQLLVEMDGFQQDEAIILMASTNRPDVLDPALLRPGRFDRRVVVPRPDLAGRLAILKVHSRRLPLAEDVDLDVIARGTIGFVGADLENLVNEAALHAARCNGRQVQRADFEAARDKVMLGGARRSLLVSDTDRRMSAYHEAGHALVALLSPEDSDPVHKVTIVPHGTSLGLTQTLPSEDRLCLTRARMLGRVRHMLGGRAAEEIVFGHRSSGAAGDLAGATRRVRTMICRYGMSERIGPVFHDVDQSQVFLGRDWSAHRGPSQHKSDEIDQETTRLLRELYDEALARLRGHRELLERIAQALLERETLDAGDLAELMASA